MAGTFVIAAAVILPAHVTEKKKKGESKKKEKKELVKNGEVRSGINIIAIKRWYEKGSGS